jgi:DNA primase
MKKRFSSEELYAVRNSIPINLVIRDIVKLRSELKDKIFRFACPICSKFNTSTNPRTNLARCFGCARNFNSIDIVMLAADTAFVPSVLTLKKYRDNVSKGGKPKRDSRRLGHSLQPQLAKDILVALCR